jgi:hypothetical protein
MRAGLTVSNIRTYATGTFFFKLSQAENLAITFINQCLRAFHLNLKYMCQLTLYCDACVSPKHMKETPSPFLPVKRSLFPVFLESLKT